MQTLVQFITYTKGIEYLIAIAFLLSFIVFWRLIQSPARPAPVAAAAGATAAPPEGEVIGGFLMPEGVYFHWGHAWARAAAGDLLMVGVDDFGQKLVGKIDGIQTPPLGAQVRQGEQGWALLADGQTIHMLSPVDGEVVEINPELAQSPAAVNEDPFGKGWLMKVRNPRQARSLKGLLSGNLARVWLEEAKNLLLARTTHELGPVLADSGPLREGIARTLEGDRWPELARNLFLTADND